MWMKWRRFDRDMEEELRFHMDKLEAEMLDAGMSADDARREARIAFGGMDQIREGCRDARPWRLLQDVLNDVRVGVRSLGKVPLISALTILTIGVSVGLAVATFSIVQGTLFRPLPFDRGHRIMGLDLAGARTGQPVDFEALDLRDFRARQTSFEDLHGYFRRRVSLADEDAARLTRRLK